MPITAIMRCQHNPNWWHTIEDCNVEIDEEPQTGLCNRYFDDHNLHGKTLLSVDKKDALMIRDAINRLYPPEND